MLVMKPRGRHREADVHSIVNDVRYHLKDRRNDVGSTARSGNEQGSSAGIHDDRRAHGRKNALPRCDCVGLPLTSPNAFGLPGFDVKSSISSFRRNPVPETVTADPKLKFKVVVSATTFPALSATEKCVV